MENISNKKRKYFGTDGIRDIANNNNMTPEFVLKLGRAYVLFLNKKGHKCLNIAVGRDTRHSGPMIQSALIAGMNSAGANVTDLGVIPTPGASYALSKNNFSGGAIISASHNPAEYNGIKFLDSKGFKLNDMDELLIEEMLEFEKEQERPIGGEVGIIYKGGHFSEEYLSSLILFLHTIKSQNFAITVDAANGAASTFVKPLYEHWNDKVTFLANTPDGLNINNGVGVTHMDFLSAATVKNFSKLGIAYDGDTDRVLMCDSKGRIIDGDIMLWVIARWLAIKNELGSGLVATVMSNMVLEDLLAEEGIKVFRCGVGDRYVLDTMRKEKSMLGGEQSGHIIALNYSNTGDGLSSGNLFLKAIEELNEDISTLVDRFDKYPQTLTNIKITDKEKLMNHPILKETIVKAEKMLSGKGRMLLRPSGTEPLLRIFVESRDAKLKEKIATMLENVIKNILSEES